MSRAVKAAIAVGVVLVLIAVGFVIFVASLLGSVLNTADQVDQQGCAPTGGTVAEAALTHSPVATADKPGALTAARAALRAGWSQEDAVIAVAIAGCESTWDPHIQNSIGASGLWQILLSAHPQYAGQDWRDPDTNATMAHALWKQSKWQPWVCFTDGGYRTHLPEARAAVAKAAHESPAVLIPSEAVAPAAPAAADEGAMAGLKPVSRRAAGFVRSHFGFNGTIGGYATSGHIADSKHYQGLAIDVMVPLGPLADRITNYFAGPGYKPFGVDNVIHNHRIYNAGRGWHAYTGTSPHTDHVHIDFHDGGGTGAVPAAEVVPAVQQDVPCPPAAVPGVLVGGSRVVYPLPAGSGYHDAHNWGHDASLWAHGHTGTDLGVACGTRVLAATDGTIQIDPFSGWAGPWLVKVSTGKGKLTTWYAHMRKVTVAQGDHVTAGQQIGEVGNLGHAYGCHLHFEVHPHGGGIYQDGIDPSKWLAANVGRTIGGTPVIASASTPATGATGFNFASFNIHGASHTGNASADARLPRAVQVLTNHNVDVVGFQEMQHRQAVAFDRRTRGTFTRWSGSKDTDNSIAWRTSTFDWISGRTLSIPYFDFQHRRMPYVCLRHRATKQRMCFFNDHNAADTRQYPHQGAERAAALRIEIPFLNHEAAKQPTFWSGDMNDHHFMSHLGGSVMRGASANTYGHIDWLLHSPGQRFVTVTTDDTALVNRTTDHPFVVAQVAVGATQ